MNPWKTAIVVLALLLAGLAVKLIWFSSPFGQEVAWNTAQRELAIATDARQLDLGKFGPPHAIDGSNDHGFSFHWYFIGLDGQTRLDVIMVVSPLDAYFTGTPLAPDCRSGRDRETRRFGFDYLCKAR